MSQGSTQQNKSLAKKEVCLKVCEILFQMDGDELDERLRVNDLDVTLGDPDACFVDDDPRDDEISTSLIENKKKNVRIRPHVASKESHSLI